MADMIRAWIYVDPDAVSVKASVSTVVEAGVTVQTRVSIGASGYPTTNTHAAAQDYTAADTTIATSSTGTGWVLVLLQTRRTIGANSAVIVNFRVSELEVTSSLPSPPNE